MPTLISDGSDFYSAQLMEFGVRARRALHDFRVADGLGDNDTWDEATQEGVRDRQFSLYDHVCAERARSRL